MLDPSNYNVLVYPAPLNTLSFRRSHKLQAFINSYLFKICRKSRGLLTLCRFTSADAASKRCMLGKNWKSIELDLKWF